MKNQPKLIKTILILSAVQVFISLSFYVVFVLDIVQLEGVTPAPILYTFLAYVVIALFIFQFVKKKNLLGLRMSLLVNIVISLPLKAFIGILIALISLGISFHQNAKSYFKAMK